MVVDALSGEVLTAFNEVPSEAQAGSGLDLFGERRPISVWSEDQLYLVDTSKPMFDPTSDPPSPDTTRGGIVILDAVNQPPTNNPKRIPELFYITSNDPNTWSVPDGISAVVGLSQTYDYYLDRHGRNSLDGNGGGLLAIVRLGLGYQNAFWSGSYMAFGTGDTYAGSLDVVGHELTHGVTQHTANLVYRDETGAILDTVVSGNHVRPGGRVVLCGLARTDDLVEGEPASAGPRLLPLVPHQYDHRRDAFLKDAIAWFAEGHLRYKEDIVEGLHNAAEHFCRLMRGENFGKALVKA